jgi:Kef-type K+ transport system membrane component KefB
LGLGELSFLPEWPPQFGPVFEVALLLIIAVLAGELAHAGLRVTRVVGYVAVGALLGPSALGVVDAKTVQAFGPFVDIAVGLLLFELGQRVDLGWLRRNPWLLATSVLESALAFAAVYGLLIVLGAEPGTAAAISVFAMATSPAVVLTVIRDLRAQGQVTERALLLTALNTAYAVVGVTVVYGWLHWQDSGALGSMLAHPLYVVFASIAAAAVFAAVSLALMTLFGRRPAFQFVLIIAMVLLGVGVARGFKLSLPLTLLLAGVLMRTFNRRRAFGSLEFGEPATVFIVILFAVAGATLQWSDWRAALVPALGFVAARFVGKAIPLFLLARPSALAVRKASLLNLALMPMSGLTLLLLGELTTLFPKIGGQVAATVMLATSILTIAGPLLAEFALRRAGESAEEPTTQPARSDAGGGP